MIRCLSHWMRFCFKTW